MPKMTDYPTKPAPATDDLVLLVDVHDASQDPKGSTKVAAISTLPTPAGITPPAGDIGGTALAPTVIATHVPALTPTGLTGAAAASRYVGATASGPPVTGTFLLGDFAVDQTGKIWICTTAGSPGTWTAAGPTIPVTIAQGGTGQATQQAAIDALTGTQSAGKVLRSDGTHATLSAIQAGDLPAIAALTAVAITTTGATFSPKVVLAAGSTATVTWTCPGVLTTTGLTPALSFGTAATRTVYMTCKDANGYDAMDQITEFNIGFLNTDDNGKSSLDATHNWTSQAVSGITGIRNMKGLQVFCAANINGGNVTSPPTNLSGTLDFTGLGQLQYIEIFNSRVTAVYLGGCSSLVRVCVEQNNLTALDINPAQPNLQDLRAAAMFTGTVKFTPLVIPAKSQWHYCIRDQVVTNLADPSLLSVVEQLWIWNTRQAGTLRTYSAVLSSLIAHSNDYTALDLSGSPTPAIDVAANLLTAVTLPTGAGAGIGTAQLQDNAFSQATVDSILSTFNGYGTSGGTLHLAGNAAPSAAGTTSANGLTGRGWTVTTGAGSIRVVQTALSGTFTAPVTLGNTVIVVAGAYNAGGAINWSAPTLNGSAVPGAYAVFNAGSGNGILAPLLGGSQVSVTAWVLPNCPAANGIAIPQTGGNTTGIAIMEVSGLGAAPVLDLHLAATGGATAAVDAGATGEVASLQEIIVGCSQVYALVVGGSSPGAPWTVLNPASPTYAGYRFQSVAQGKAYRWQQTAQAVNQPWSAGIFSLHA